MPDPAAIRALPNWWVGDRPQHWLAGVFEGGGLKGVAYAGALSAVVDQSAWFGAVTGASAGAITAALIAAGASPDDISRLTNELADVFMQHIRFGDAKPGTVRAAKPNRASTSALVWHGKSRLRDPKISALGTGNDLVKWLNAELEHLLVTNWNEANNPLDPHDATFGALFERTGIELVIVAVDSVSSRHCIFSHSTTPSCSVADAAIASASIPFVLRPRRLELATNDADATRYVYPIVDGGVWTNFPKFVFDDAQFRRYHGLGEQPDLTVVGFLLDEVSAADYRMTMTPTARFVDQSELEPKRRPRVLPAEALLSWKATEIEKCLKSRDSRRGRIVQEFRETELSKALQTPETIPGFRITRREKTSLDKTSDTKPPRPETARASNMTTALDFLEVLGVAFWWSLLAWVGIAVGLAYGAFTLFERVVAPRTSWREALLVAALYLPLLLGALLVALILPILAGNSLGYLAMRKSAVPLATTYIRGSGAPYWLLEPSPFATGTSSEPPSNIVRLPVHDKISTLRIRGDKVETAALILARQTALSHETTTKTLRALFNGPAGARSGVAH
jgi:predicted acylesterase/phospholipase RssA